MAKEDKVINGGASGQKLKKLKKLAKFKNPAKLSKSQNVGTNVGATGLLISKARVVFT